MLEFDLETWCAEWSYATLSEEKSIIKGISAFGTTSFDRAKLQQIEAIEKANRIVF